MIPSRVAVPYRERMFNFVKNNDLVQLDKK